MNLVAFSEEVRRLAGGAVLMNVQHKPDANGKGKPRFSADVIFGGESLNVSAHQQRDGRWRSDLRSSVHSTWAMHDTHGTGALEHAFANLRTGTNVIKKPQPRRREDFDRW